MLPEPTSPGAPPAAPVIVVMLAGPVPVRAGLFDLDPQGQVPGLPRLAGTPPGWWLVPMPVPFLPLVATDDPNPR